VRTGLEVDRSTRTLAWAHIFDRKRRAAALSRPSALALRHAARTRKKSRPRLVALASRSDGEQQAAENQPTFGPDGWFGVLWVYATDMMSVSSSYNTTELRAVNYNRVATFKGALSPLEPGRPPRTRFMCTCCRPQTAVPTAVRRRSFCRPLLALP
jgi:hypothetical protein